MTETGYQPQDSVAVVTGGAGAIGGAIAEALRSGGHRVVIVDRNGDVACDLADAEQIRQTADGESDETGKSSALTGRRTDLPASCNTDRCSPVHGE
jgi:nucleoside-diphosphate-sugar epimerase